MKNLRLKVVLTLVAALLYAGYWTAQFLYDELESNEIQARFFAEHSFDYFHWVSRSESRGPLKSPQGPFDLRRGYDRAESWQKSLNEGGFETTWTAGTSPAMRKASEELGVFPIYDTPAQRGLQILSSDGEVLYEHRSPEVIFERFEDLPEVLITSLLFIENRALLRPGGRYQNPALEWRRFTHAALALVGRRLGLTNEHFGGSTLATQLEKFRHSPEGLTLGEEEKLRQMLTATLRAYQDGPETLPRQRQIVLDYVNGVPLAASPGFGEVHGMADGLRIWYGVDHRRVMESLERLQRPMLSADLEMSSVNEEYLQDAAHFRMVLSLLLAHRRPSHFLVQAPQDLRVLTDTYARVMANEGVISQGLRDAVLSASVEVLPRAPELYRPAFRERKAIDSVRVALRSALGAASLYEVDRFDVVAQSTIDARAQQAAETALHQLANHDYLKDVGLFGHRLLSQDNPLEELTVSFTLFESTERGNALRILADNYDQPMNINEHVKLDLGSTAKLRTLVTYLEVISELHFELTTLREEELQRVEREARDGLRRWVAGQLLVDQDLSLQALLEKAMKRPYSASPSEVFFTGGGLHTFSNFENRRNHVQSVEEAFRHSVNLPFIRMMREISDYFLWLDPERMNVIFAPGRSAERTNLLQRFADREGSDFQRQFLSQYQRLPRDKIIHRLLTRRAFRPNHVAMLARTFPEITPDELAEFVGTYGGYTATPAEIERWFQEYSTENLNWQDRGYLTRVHPLEIWTASYLLANPGATQTEVLTASREVRQEVYQWLLRTRARAGQDRRIRTLLEEETFDQIHLAWSRLGYPFDSLVPSLATSIGSSADRPLSLAELVGILLNDGIRYPTYRVDALITAYGTPYEARYDRGFAQGERVMSPEVARVARMALIDVVNEGTARRIAGVLRNDEGLPILVGGKTGTGDHRRKTFQGLQMLDSQPVSRSATFVFLLDERFFGTITVFVEGAPADQFRFTSALPVTLLRILYPGFRHLLETPQPSDLDFELPRNGDPLTALALTAAGAPRDEIREAALTRYERPREFQPRLAQIFDWTKVPNRSGEIEEIEPEERRPSRWDWERLLEPERIEEPVDEDRDRDVAFAATFLNRHKDGIGTLARGSLQW